MKYIKILPLMTTSIEYMLMARKWVIEWPWLLFV